MSIMTMKSIYFYPGIRSAHSLCGHDFGGIARFDSIRFDSDIMGYAVDGDAIRFGVFPMKSIWNHFESLDRISAPQSMPTDKDNAVRSTDKGIHSTRFLIH